MDFYNEILNIADKSKIELKDEIKETMDKELHLGMSRFVCRYGTLGDGFEKFTDSQKYYQANREAYIRSCEMTRTRAMAKKAYAELLDARKKLELTSDNIEKLKYEADVELAELRLFELLVQTQDTARQLDEFNKIRLELRDKVRAQYPEGIEQSEIDNWSMVLKYRIFKGKDVESIPLPVDEKARIGIEFGRKDLLAAKVLENNEFLKNVIPLKRE